MRPSTRSETERAIGNPQAPRTAVEWFSLTCPHCAHFALETLPELKAKLDPAGKLRWVFYDYPTDGLALQAAMVARYLPPQKYQPFIMALFKNQDHWAYAQQSAGCALADGAAIPGWIGRRSITRSPTRSCGTGSCRERRTPQSRWNMNATPSFLINGKLYEGAMSACRFCRSFKWLAEELALSVQFRRLRIAGFKSFAEPVSVEIHPGLTGIVGPNGCGKSNVVEALRWAMGEQSTRSPARRRDGRRDLRRHRRPAVAQPRRGDADAGRDRRRGAAAVPRAGGTGDHPADRARLRQRLPGERQGGARARRADAVRRPGDRARTPRAW